jgi:hypothetical protein
MISGPPKQSDRRVIVNVHGHIVYRAGIVVKNFPLKVDLFKNEQKTDLYTLKCV